MHDSHTSRMDQATGGQSQSQSLAAQAGLFDDYRPPGDAYDEFHTPANEQRAHWDKFGKRLNRIGLAEFERRWKQAERLVRENGVTFNTYSDPLDKTRPWQLDPLPLLIDSDEWETISAGLRQRATLLNMVLADLYGPQDTLRQGLLPASLVYSHPSFNRVFFDVDPSDERYLHLYAADLARSPDGPWWVVGDRTQAPGGMGYALENRIVISWMLPSVIRDCHVERLASFFMALQNTLGRLSSNESNPRVVVLSQGPNNPNYFEDAYLSRYLGYTLVEANDVSVRQNRALLKTLGGLTPIDVILRRIEDLDCDPLELRSDSPHGTAGLVHAARRKTVALANGVGSGLVQAPAFMAFLPSLCEALLGEKLLIPSVATWWCGGEKARKYVLANLHRLVIRPAYRQSLFDPIHGDALTQEHLQATAARIQANPAMYVAQEKVARSYAPVWSNGQLQSSYVAWRAFCVADDQDYQAMPGGLLRVSSDAARLDLSIAAGEGSKDVWVLSKGPVKQVSLLQSHSHGMELRRSGAELPSRVAENLFWLGRHVERAEGAVQSLRTVLVRLTGERQREETPDLSVLLHALAEQGHIEPGFVVEGIRQQLPAIEQALPMTVFDAHSPGSLRYTLTALHRGAAILRDRISGDAWRIINRIDQQFQPPDRSGSADMSDLLVSLNQVILDLAAFSGLVMESMTRGQGWRFLDIGRRLERGLYTSGLLLDTLVQVRRDDGALLEAVLEIADSLMTYRSRYMSNLQIAPALDLLLTDETNPRSVAFQLAALAEHSAELPQTGEQPLYTEEQQLTMTALHSVRMLNVVDLCDSHVAGRRLRLEKFLKGLQLQLPKLSESICHKYLMHVDPSRQLGELRF